MFYVFGNIMNMSTSNLVNFEIVVKVGTWRDVINF